MKGGLETRLHNYIGYFLERGDAVTVVCSQIDKGINLPEGVKVEQLSVRHIPKPFRPFAFHKKVKKYLKANSFQFTLSLGRTEASHVLAPATHLGYLKYMGQKTRRLSDYMQVFLDKASYRSASKVFACSSFIKDELEELYRVEGDKVEVLYPPFNESKFDRSLIENKEEFRQKEGFTDEDVVFLFVSTGHKRKGLPFLLKLFAQLPHNFKLVVFGRPEVKSSLPNVIYGGYSKSLAEWYVKADFLIHPAKYEPYGQIITEALYMQTPVIISDKVGAKELLAENEGLVLTEGDLSIWLKTIKEIVATNYVVKEDFVERNKLSLYHHMDKMLVSS